MAIYELQNLATKPATDEALVRALLAFTNGAEVVISGQDSRYGEPRSRAADRAAYVELLDAVIAGRPGPLPMLEDQSGRLRPGAAVIRCLAKLPNPLNRVALVRSERVLIARPRGYALAHYRQFKRAASALAEAALLFLDADRPYGRALCRCKDPACGHFYLAKKNPRGGPANRTYCDPEHRLRHNNSSQRKRKAAV